MRYVFTIFFLSWGLVSNSLTKTLVVPEREVRAGAAIVLRRTLLDELRADAARVRAEAARALAEAAAAHCRESWW